MHWNEIQLTPAGEDARSGEAARDWYAQRIPVKSVGTSGLVVLVQDGLPVADDNAVRALLNAAVQDLGQVVLPAALADGPPTDEALPAARDVGAVHVETPRLAIRVPSADVDEQMVNLNATDSDLSHGEYVLFVVCHPDDVDADRTEAWHPLPGLAYEIRVATHGGNSIRSGDKAIITYGPEGAAEHPFGPGTDHVEGRTVAATTPNHGGPATFLVRVGAAGLDGFTVDVRPEQGAFEPYRTINTMRLLELQPVTPPSAWRAPSPCLEEAGL